MGTLEYSHNNSGGSWWLKDEDWKNLEKAGWKVQWTRSREWSPCERWLGALATSAEKEFESEEDGIREWKSIVGQNPNKLGCSCCGRPHYFFFSEKKNND